MRYKGPMELVQHLIKDCASILNLPLDCYLTALVFSHKFIASELAVPSEMISMASLYLACKVTENPTKVRDLINVAFYLKTQKQLSIGNEYWRLRDSVISSELLLLRVLGFSVRPVYSLHLLAKYLDIAFEGNNNECNLEFASECSDLLIEWFFCLILVMKMLNCGKKV